MSDDEVAAEAIGINTTRYKITAFVVGSFFAGVAGGIYSHFKLFITPTGFDFTRSIEIVVMVILGGMGNIVGVIIAAILLTLLPEVLRPVRRLPHDSRIPCCSSSSCSRGRKGYLLSFAERELEP